MSQLVGLKGRKFATKPGKIGAFTLPKLLRYAARMGIPGLLDIDMHAAHVHAMWELAEEELQRKEVEQAEMEEVIEEKQEEDQMDGLEE